MTDIAALIEEAKEEAGKRWGHQPPPECFELRIAAALARFIVSPPPQHQPDWPPQSSATSYPEGTQKYGSTGQLWEVREGSWVRLPAPPAAAIAGLLERANKYIGKTHGISAELRDALRALALEIERLSKLADSYRDLAGEQQFKWGSRNIALEQRIRELEAELSEANGACDAQIRRANRAEAERDAAIADCDEWKARYGSESRLVDSAIAERDAIKRKTIEDCAQELERSAARGETTLIKAICHQQAAIVRALAHSESEGKEEST